MPVSAGDRLGDFSILRAVGEGGMGVVYLTRDERLDCQVAPQLAHDPEFQKALGAEARSAAAIAAAQASRSSPAPKTRRRPGR